MAITIMILDSLGMSIWVFLTLFCEITCVTLISLIIIPAPAWGNKFAAALKCKPGSVVFPLVSGILPALIINTICCLLISAISVFGSAEIPAEMKMGIWTSGVLRDWPIMLVISYIAAQISSLLGGLVVKACIPKPPVGA